MRRSFNLKYAVVAGIAMVLWISSGFVRSLVDERQGRAQSVRTELANILTDEQNLGAPTVVYPYVEITRDGKGKELARATREAVYATAGAKYAGEAVVTERKRGIFRALAYDLALRGEASFALPTREEFWKNEFTQKVKYGDIELLTPYLTLQVSHRKGLQAFPEIRIDGVAEPLAGKACGGGYCFYPGFSLEQIREKVKRVSVSWKVAGLEQFKFTTNAVNTEFELKSNWPSPSFGGEHLPTAREVAKDGFSAKWSIFRNAGETATFGVRFVDPVDVYTLADRATKYAILFIVCVFVGFFVVEVFRRIRLHAIQYALVGASLVVFYLLVLTLSEHVAFASAYLLSVAASVALVRIYLGGALRSGRDANLFAGALVLLYGLLYAILSAEDYALLCGTLLVFGLLGAVMILTRKTDWFRIERELGQDGERELAAEGGAATPAGTVV